MLSDYDKIPSIQNAKKIQHFFSYDINEYTIFYKDGSKKVFYDRELDGLREYINDNGYKLYMKDIKFIALFLISGVITFLKGKSYGSKIEFQDNLEMKKSELVQIKQVTENLERVI